MPKKKIFNKNIIAVFSVLQTPKKSTQALLNGLEDHGYEPIFVIGKSQLRETLLQTIKQAAMRRNKSA
jgi:RNA-binding protein YhbY